MLQEVDLAIAGDRYTYRKRKPPGENLKAFGLTTTLIGYTTKADDCVILPAASIAIGNNKAFSTLPSESWWSLPANSRNSV